ncbi:hypothetical protein BASA81_012116 [Batrachochytrium salamandrivorans]|nr:hypothetical protein BASA81_012116 [Batrachochytrium salamandrivorans]
MRRSASSGAELGLPSNFQQSSRSNSFPKANSLNSLSSLSSSRNGSPSSSTTSLRGLSLPKKRSMSYNQLHHVPSLSSIQEEDGKHLRWGHVEEFGWNSDVDSRASSRMGGDDGDTDSGNSDRGEDDDDDGWGWYPEEPPTSPSRASATARSNRAFSDQDSPKSAKSPPPSPAASNSLPTPAPSKRNRSILRSFGSPTPLEPLAIEPNNALLVLGTKHWPQRQNKRKRPGILSSSTYTSSSSPVSSPPSSPTNNNQDPAPVLRSFVIEAKAKKYPLLVSSTLIMARGMGTGYVMRAVPNAFFRALSWCYSTRVDSNHWEAIRTGLFLGLSMTTFHIFALSNVSELPFDPYEYEEEQEDEDGESIKIPWPPVAALVMTPLLAILPPKSRLSMALYMSARATESVFNALLARLSPSLRRQLPVSQWLFSLGIAQIVYIWLFHRAALPTELARFLDSTNSFKIEGMQQQGGEPPGKRLVLGSGVVEFIASDVFSAASLFGPVFDVKSSLTLLASVGKSSRAAVVLILSAIFSRVGLVALSKLLHRFSPMNGYWAGFVAGMFAVQFEREDNRRTELAMFALTFAFRALYGLAGMRNIVPPKVPLGEFGLYFASLVVVLTAANIKSPWLLLGSTFRTLVRRCVIP